MSPHTLSFLNSIRVRFIQPFKSGAYLSPPGFMRATEMFLSPFSFKYTIINKFVN